MNKFKHVKLEVFASANSRRASKKYSRGGRAWVENTVGEEDLQWKMNEFKNVKSKVFAR